MKKTYISASQLQQDSFTLAKKVIESDYQPTFLVGVWRGGTPIAIALHETLDVCGIRCEHTPIQIRSYTGIDNRNADIEIIGLEYLTNKLTTKDRLLIVDDVHDSGLSMQTLINKINAAATPAQIKIAVAYYKAEKNQVDFKPDFYVGKTNQWLVFPHELSGLSRAELQNEKPDIENIKTLLLNRTNNNLD